MLAVSINFRELSMVHTILARSKLVKSDSAGSLRLGKPRQRCFYASRVCVLLVQMCFCSSAVICFFL